MDPKDILGEHLTYQGVDGRSAGSGNARDAEQSDTDAVATRDQCLSAARRVAELGFEQTVVDESDPDAKKKLLAGRQAFLNSDAIQHQVQRQTEECLARGTSAQEAKCIARAGSESKLEACFQ